MLTRKHFKAAAEKNLEVITYFKNMEGITPQNKNLILKALHKMVWAQASWLSRENPNFDWDKFTTASGVEPLEEN